MIDIFISYKREEQLRAKRLAVALEQHGWSVWWDPQLHVGKHFDDEIEKALQDAKCVIVLWSRQSVNSRYVRDEATYALNRDKLIPVAIEDADLPFRFSGIQTAQLQKWDGSDTFPEFLKLVNDIRSIIGSPSKITSDRNQEHGELTDSASGKKAELQKSGTRKAILSKQTTGRTNVVLFLNIAVILALCLFYLSAITNACNNHDILFLSTIVGFPLSLYLIFQNWVYRIIWILAPCIGFFIGMPYGHNHGTITKSPLFGLDQGSECQTGPEVPVIFGILVIAAVIEHLLFLRRSKKREKVTDNNRNEPGMSG